MFVKFLLIKIPNLYSKIIKFYFINSPGLPLLVYMLFVMQIMPLALSWCLKNVAALLRLSLRILKDLDAYYTALTACIKIALVVEKLAKIDYLPG